MNAPESAPRPLDVRVGSATDGLTGLDQVGAFIAYVAIVASFVLAWSLYASDYSRYLPPDVTVGNNHAVSEVPGYSATVGWDAVTGLGTPNAANLVPDLVAATHA